MKLTQSILTLLACIASTTLSINYDKLTDGEIYKMIANADFDTRINMATSADGKTSKKFQQIFKNPDLWANYRYKAVDRLAFNPYEHNKLFAKLRNLELYIGSKTIPIDPNSSKAQIVLDVIAAAKIPGDMVCDLSAPLSDRAPENPDPYRVYHFKQFLAFYDYLKNNTKYNVLDLTNDNFGEQNIATWLENIEEGWDQEPITNLLRKNKTIKTLIMKNISFASFPIPPYPPRGDTTELAKDFAKILRENTSLTTLDMSDINLGSENAKTLTDGLSSNKTLKTFILSGNNIDQKTQTAIRNKFPKVKFIF